MRRIPKVGLRRLSALEAVFLPMASLEETVLLGAWWPQGLGVGGLPPLLGHSSLPHSRSG